MASPEQAPTAVLDASALMALLKGEHGASTVASAIERRAAIGVANWAEVLSKAAEAGTNPQALATGLREHALIGNLLSIEPITEADCVVIANLRPATKTLGLSLADRACLALADRLGVPALTADGAFARADIGVAVKLIR